MNSYGWSLCGQTILALGVLGLLGGWVLWPFRRADRPFLWLAAPLAGMNVLTVSLFLLFHWCRLTIPASLTLSVLLGLPVLYFLGRWARHGGKLPHSTLALLVVAALALWCTRACNHLSIRHREPTLAGVEGSDQWGYCAAAAWHLDHPHEQPAFSVERPSEAYLNYLLCQNRDRPGAYLLVAAATWARGTSPVFSYDWLCGVALAAAILGLAGAFAARPGGLFLLLASGVICAWLSCGRTGYLAKLLAYPGCLLLGALFLQVWLRSSASRVAAVLLLAQGTRLCLHPMTTVALLGLAFGGLTGALVGHRLFGSAVPGFMPEGRFPWGRYARGVALYALLVLPFFPWDPERFFFGVPGYTGISWGMALPAALDVESPSFLLGPAWGGRLAWAALGVSGLLLALAFRGRNAEGVSYLLCVGLLGIAWLLDKKSIYAFHGVLFPMSAAGAVLVLQKQQEEKSPRRLRWLAAALAVLLIALRVPQFERARDRYTRTNGDWPACYKQSEAKELRERIGGRSVDVITADVNTCCFAWLELAARGVAVQYREPSWSRLLAWTSWPAPPCPKGYFTLADGHAWTAPGALCLGAPHLTLSEDRDALTIASWKPPSFSLASTHSRLGPILLFLKGGPTAVDLWNGTQRTQEVVFTTDSQPEGAAPRERTVRFRFNNAQGTQVLNDRSGWHVRLRLRVPPGLHRLTLVADESGPSSAPGPSDGILLTVWNCRLEQAPPSEGNDASALEPNR
jgi:hypothetical protein